MLKYLWGVEHEYRKERPTIKSQVIFEKNKKKFSREK